MSEGRQTCIKPNATALCRYGEMFELISCSINKDGTFSIVGRYKCQQKECPKYLKESLHLQCPVG